MRSILNFKSAFLSRLNSGMNYTTKRKIQSAISKTLRFVLIFCLCFIILYPLLYMISVSLRTRSQMNDPTIVWIPKELHIENYAFVIKIMNYPETLLRTVLLSVGCSFAQCITCCITGYGFARFKFKGRNILFLLVLFTLIVPPQIITMPLFVTFQNFDFFGIGKIIEAVSGYRISINLINTIFPMLFSVMFGVGIRSGLFIYISRQFFKNMPVELEDASAIDGCGPIKTFISVMAPNARSVMLVSFLFSLVWYWNDTFYVSMFYNSVKPLSLSLMSLAVRISPLIGTATETFWLDLIIYNQVGCFLFILPVLLLYLILQRYFVQSIERTGIVG